MNFASRPRTFEEFRWRLQLIAELWVGRYGRAEDAAEAQQSKGLFAMAASLTNNRPN